MYQSRKKLLQIAEKEIDALPDLSTQERKFLLNYFRTRLRIIRISSSQKSQQHNLELARRKVLKAMHTQLHEMGEKHEIDIKIFKTLERELDLEESLSISSEIK